MGDISTWSPTDNSNTAAPPDGWPESMAPSGVNNSARAMMGAVRRWYDTVAVQLATYLPLAGGTLTGTLSAPQYNISGAAFARTDSGTTSIFDPAGAYAIQLQVAANLYIANLHLFRNDAGTEVADIDNIGNLRLIGNYQYFAGSTGTVNATGGPLIYADTSNHVYKLGSGGGGFLFQNYAGAGIGGITAAGTLNIGSITSVGNITAPAFIGNVSVPANGPVSTGGTVTGGQVTSTGNISATSGTVSAANVTASSNVTAAGSVTGGFIHSTGTCQIDGQSNLLGTVNFGPSGSYARIDGVGTYNISGSWLTFSSREVKENITSYEGAGLDAVLALRPVQFNYRPELFGAEEAERVRYGLVAEEVAEVLPEMVGQATFGGRDISTLNTGHISMVLLNACRELAAQNAALAARLALLEAESGAARR